MKNQLKSAVLAATIAFGIASVAHASQQPAETSQRQMPASGQSMNQSQMMSQSGQGSMMNNPEMRQRMTAMMERCRRMRSRMGAEPVTMPAMQDRR